MNWISPESATCLAEYAAKLPNEYAGEAYYKEHYELMIGEKALQKLKNL